MMGATARADRIGTGAGDARPGIPAGGGGQVYLDGAGSVRVQGNFLAFGDVAAMSVRVTDRYGDARVRLGGRPMMTPVKRSDGATRRHVDLPPGPRRRVSIEGSRAEVSFRGDGNVTLSITGAGTVRLEGVGTYRVNNGAGRGWPMGPVAIRLAPTRPGGRG